MNTKDYAAYKKIFQDNQAPFAFLDLDYLKENIESILNVQSKLNIRIATKSIRCRAVLEYILAANPRFKGLMCFTVAEAVFLSRAGFDDLLVAYPSVDKAALAEACLEIKKGKTIYLMVDHPRQIELIESIASSHNISVPLCLDLDMSSHYPGLHFGVWRSPLDSPKKVLRLAQAIKPFEHVSVAGLMGYEAQIAGVGNQVPGQAIKNKVIQQLQNKSFKQIVKRRKKTVTMLKKAGFQLKFVNGGGTGSLKATSKDPSVTEITVGSGFYAPVLFDYYQDFQYHPAAAFAMPIVRQPSSRTYTCLGGGYIASGATGKEKQPSVYLPIGASLFELEGAGEVQTPIKYTGPEKIKLGDPVFFRHSKAGELCERFNEMLWVENEKVEKVVKTYRGEGQCFL